MSIIDTMVNSGHLTEEQAERTKSAVEEVIKAASEDPQFAAELQKVAASPEAAIATAKVMSGNEKLLPQMWSNFKANAKTVAESDLPKYVILAGATEGIRSLTGGITNLYDAVKAKFEAHQNFETMLDKNPSLRSHPDQDMVRASFNTLQKFNPAYASDPLVAGTFVRNSLDMERMHMGELNQMVDAYKKYHDTHKEGPGIDTFDALSRMHVDPQDAALDAVRKQVEEGRTHLIQQQADWSASRASEADARADLLRERKRRAEIENDAELARQIALNTFHSQKLRGR